MQLSATNVTCSELRGVGARIARMSNVPGGCGRQARRDGLGAALGLLSSNIPAKTAGRWFRLWFAFSSGLGRKFWKSDFVRILFYMCRMYEFLKVGARIAEGEIK